MIVGSVISVSSVTQVRPLLGISVASLPRNRAAKATNIIVATILFHQRRSLPHFEQIAAIITAGIGRAPLRGLGTLRFAPATMYDALLSSEIGGSLVVFRAKLMGLAATAGPVFVGVVVATCAKKLTAASLEAKTLLGFPGVAKPLSSAKRFHLHSQVAKLSHDATSRPAVIDSAVRESVKRSGPPKGFTMQRLSMHLRIFVQAASLRFSDSVTTM